MPPHVHVPTPYPARARRRWPALALCAAAACGGSSDDPLPPPPAVRGVSVSAPAAAVEVGGAMRLNAVIDADAGASRALSWFSRDPAVATVSDSGVVTAVAPGSVWVGALARAATGVGDSTRVTVTAVAPAAVATVAVAPAAVTVQIGATAPLVATPSDAAGNVLAGRAVQWSSDRPSVAAVDAAGVVRGMAAGSATVTATVEGRSATAAVTVAPRTAVVAVTPDSVTVEEARTVTLSATVTGDPGVSQAVTWASDNTAVATISAAGVVTAVAPGRARVTATSVATPAGAASAVVVVTPRPRLTFAQISAGQYHTCGLTGDGTAYCWGDNGSGRLGDGTTTDRHLPTRVSTTERFAQIVSGAAHSCARAADGRTFCWGSNLYTQLGIGRGDAKSTPQLVPGQTFVEIAAGFNHTCGRTQAGSVYCWGEGSYGRLGTGSTQDSGTPALVQGAGLTFAQISAGRWHSCALTAAGAAYCWGVDTKVANARWQDASAPTAVAGGLAFAEIGAGDKFTCARTADGRAYCWGSTNASGQQGNGSTGTTHVLAPSEVGGGLRFASLAVGVRHACGVTAARAAYCWGENGYGQLGLGVGGDRTEPAPVSGSGGPIAFARLTSAESHTCGWSDAGAAYCWGRNASGSLGIGSLEGPVGSPRPVASTP